MCILRVCVYNVRMCVLCVRVCACIQLGFERAQLKRVEKEQKRLRSQLEEARLQQKQLSSSLANESQRGAELSRRLEEERVAVETLRAELEAERRQALRAEARAEEQLAEFDTEKEQLRGRLRREEGRGQALQAELQELRREVARLGGAHTEEVTRPHTDPGEKLTSDPSAPHELNGHHGDREAEPLQENGCDDSASTRHPPSVQPQQNPAACLGSSPCSSPLLAKHPLGGVAPSSPSSQASYQAGINQRFHAARHKFQGQPEQDHPGNATPSPPPDLSLNPAAPASLSASLPPTSAPQPEPASVKQLARHTVTQALSRFTGQQGGAKPPASPSSSSSPFGTDYRCPPSGPASPPARVSSPVSPGIKSPIMPRGERGHPPPIPPKKPGLAQTPMSPGPSPRAGHFHQLSSSTKEQDLLMSSTS